MQTGDDVYVYRQGELPHWYKWQGLPCTIVSFEADGTEAVCRMPDGNNVSFYTWELTPVWPPRVSDLAGKAMIQAPDYPTRTPESIGFLEHPAKSLDGTTEGQGPRVVARGGKFIDISCGTCRHAFEDGWFGLPPRTTHCSKRKPDGTWCHATWSGLNAIHCVKCHRTFSSPSALNRHKTGSNKCKDPREAKTRAGRAYFDEPIVNQYGTEIWRQTGDGRPDYRKA